MGIQGLMLLSIGLYVSFFFFFCPFEDGTILNLSSGRCSISQNTSLIYSLWSYEWYKWSELYFTGWIYVLEMALKVYSLGFDCYWMEGQNRFDFVITWIIGNCKKSWYYFKAAILWYSQHVIMFVILFFLIKPHPRSLSRFWHCDYD